MKPKEIENIEELIKTENAHWNEYASEMLCEAMQQGLFDSKVKPIQMLSLAINTITEYPEHPLKAFDLIVSELDKSKLNAEQKLFVSAWIHKYVRNSKFEELDLTLIQSFLSTYIRKLEKEINAKEPKTENIRANLKSIVEKELQQLTTTLATLEPAERLNFVCKLIPFVLPKIESISHKHGED